MEVGDLQSEGLLSLHKVAFNESESIRLQTLPPMIQAPTWFLPLLNVLKLIMNINPDAKYAGAKQRKGT